MYLRGDVSHKNSAGISVEDIVFLGVNAASMQRRKTVLGKKRQNIIMKAARLKLDNKSV